jgi:hypothetical protein
MFPSLMLVISFPHASQKMAGRKYDPQSIVVSGIGLPFMLNKTY